MDGMTTFGNSDSVFSHGEDSISMLNRLVEIAKEAYKYIPEKDCTVECGTFVDVDTRAFLSAVQHFRESIEAYRDLTEELDDDLREVRKAYADDMERIRKYDTQSVVDEKLFEQLKEDCEQERTRSNQLEKELSDKTRLFEIAKKLLRQRRDQLSGLEEELRQNLLVKGAQKKVIDKKEKQINDLHHEIWELQDQAEYLEDQVKFWKNLAKVHVKNGYIDTDIAHTYPKITPNNPANFCGNCKYFKTHLNDVGTCENIYGCYSKTVDPDDASCIAFESNQVDRDKPDHPCCEACNRDDCDDCTLCPF